MGTPAIRATDLTKCYRINRARPRAGNLREFLVGGLSSMFSAGRSSRPHDFWALNGVSFEIRHGETVGLVGRNGAGKSTLLKLLSRITRPTSGTAEIRGRLGSLLEVGTGFHPELSGRENIFLNGAILGMRRADIQRQFAEIVAFAEVEQFLDTPVKRYSSGMYVRLAFAVAAHLSSKILIVDEVLSVGDAVFQQRCLGKMGSIARDGRTVIFVSHNLTAIRELCPRVLFIDAGKIRFDGPATESIGVYLRSVEQVTALDLSQRTDRLGFGDVRLVRIRIEGDGGETAAGVATGRPVRFLFECDRLPPATKVSFTIYDAEGGGVVSFDAAIPGPDDSVEPGLGTNFVCEIDELSLLPGQYRINAGVYTGGELQDHVDGAAVFEVGHGQMRGRSEVLFHGYGSVCMPHRWRQPGPAAS